VVRASGTNDSTLLVINQIQPIYVSFTVPQQQLPAIKRYLGEGKLEVQALPAGEAKAEEGHVTFVDNTVDVATGTIRLKATFANAERRLWPGQFANVWLTLTTEPNAIVVPAQAVQTGQLGQQYVFVVQADATVENRRVVVERTQGSEAIIAQGLRPGERVVTDGQPRLVPGAKVEIRGEGAQARPGGTATQ
jgi:multidrug efflux system membrane fusion protein